MTLGVAPRSNRRLRRAAEGINGSDKGYSRNGDNKKKSEPFSHLT